MDIVIFGLSVSSSWGNGHATLWRGLIRALTSLGHTVHFFERDVPYYAGNRDLWSINGLELVFYNNWSAIEKEAFARTAHADVAIVTSYCPDALAASETIYAVDTVRKVFYDLDTPVTLKSVHDGQFPFYVSKEFKLRYYDLVLSFTGGQAINDLENVLDAPRAVPLYGSVDPDFHFPSPPVDKYRADLSYLGTFAEDRHDAFQELVIKASQKASQRSFIVCGAQYPSSMSWPSNVRHLTHVSPPEHPSFYCSSRFTLNITRASMASMGYCPSGRLFEAAACGVTILSDWWEGLDLFFNDGNDIVVVQDSDDVTRAFTMSDNERRQLAENARKKVLAEHSSLRRGAELIGYLEGIL